MISWWWAKDKKSHLNICKELSLVRYMLVLTKKLACVTLFGKNVILTVPRNNSQLSPKIVLL